jgi:glycerol-3-phosphate acyltransferase PlsY
MSSMLALLIAYLLGSIPSAYYAGRWAKGIDLRQHGSGNLGFTNAWRLLGPRWSIPVLIFDLLKGVAAVWVAHALAPDHELLPIFTGLAAILGHNWTFFLGFRGGGKGVATSAGVFLALTPVPFLITLFVFVATLAVFRYVSLASILGALALVLSGGSFRLLGLDIAPPLPYFLFSLIVAFLIILKHQANIRRLIQGTEAKFGKQHEEASS